MTATDERIAAQPAETFRRGWFSLMLLAAVWGLASMWLWQGGQEVFYDIRRRYRVEAAAWLTVAAMIATMALWMLRRSFLALGDVLGGKEPAGRQLALAVLVVVVALVLLGLERSGSEDYPNYLPPAWQWICPAPAWYRALILAPLWGAWAMLTTGQFCKPCRGDEPAVTALVHGCGPLVAAFSLAIPLIPTLLYFNYLGVKHLWMPCATVAVAIAGGVAVCRTQGGLCRRAMLAVNLLAQLAFFLSYIACR